ncbi:Eukaryotic aspartyl protease family protein [Forsythia ovata]|uniref:Eukaryotic aspartyl protease family protein n=1 Tax=Forsythia ovata TaxID=205694 RepID=A0ABD1X9V4_9LAMI
MAFSCFLFFLVLLSFISPLISSSPTSITIPISVVNTKPYSDPYQKLKYLASASLARAHNLKITKNGSFSTTPLFPYSGAYSISLKFGTPPQSIPLIMDTGSSFSWFPCTKHYVCRNCTVSSTDSGFITSFIPKQSSSAKILGCQNPKCRWIHTAFDSYKTNCTQICPPYLILYGLGSTGGIAMVETLDLPDKRIPNFVIGCSLFSSYQPAGVAGFGRGLSSLPSQLGLKKFSYCLLSHKFDNTDTSSILSMDSESNSDQKAGNLSYTPLLKNPVSPGNIALSNYYYVGLRKITVGRQRVKVPYEYLSADSNGNGGTIVDSGSTFTYMNLAVFKPVMNAFVEQVKNYERAENIEKQTGLRPCFDISGHKIVEIPQLRLHFKGGAEMELPLENYFFTAGDDKVLVTCFTMVTANSFLGQELIGRPSIILGNFQMQNFHVEYDLRNERFGFMKQSCK